MQANLDNPFRTAALVTLIVICCLAGAAMLLACVRVHLGNSSHDGGWGGRSGVLGLQAAAAHRTRQHIPSHGSCVKATVIPSSISGEPPHLRQLACTHAMAHTRMHAHPLRPGSYSRTLSWFYLYNVYPVYYLICAATIWMVLLLIAGILWFALVWMMDIGVNFLISSSIGTQW